MFYSTLLSLIRLYQRTLSPDHGFLRYLFPQAGCRFYPSCSEYTYQAIARYGVWGGIWRGLMRLGQCTPWSRGGFDPVK